MEPHEMHGNHLPARYGRIRIDADIGICQPIENTIRFTLKENRCRAP